MTTPAMGRRGELLPAFPHTNGDRSAPFVERYRGRRNLVIVLAADIGDESPVSGLLQQLRLRAAELTAELAQVLVIVTSPQMAAQHGSIGFPTLLDEGGQIHRALGAGDAAGRLGPAVFVTDRFREIFAAYLPEGPRLPGAQEILDWLVFINIQCPECGVPEWAP